MSCNVTPPAGLLSFIIHIYITGKVLNNHVLIVQIVKLDYHWSGLELDRQLRNDHHKFIDGFDTPSAISDLMAILITNVKVLFTRSVINSVFQAFFSFFDVHRKFFIVR